MTESLDPEMSRRLTEMTKVWDAEDWAAVTSKSSSDRPVYPFVADRVLRPAV